MVNEGRMGSEREGIWVSWEGKGGGEQKRKIRKTSVCYSKVSTIHNISFSTETIVKPLKFNYHHHHPFLPSPNPTKKKNKPI